MQQGAWVHGCMRSKVCLSGKPMQLCFGSHECRSLRIYEYMMTGSGALLRFISSWEPIACSSTLPSCVVDRLLCIFDSCVGCTSYCTLLKLLLPLCCLQKKKLFVTGAECKTLSRRSEKKKLTRSAASCRASISRSVTGAWDVLPPPLWDQHGIATWWIRIYSLNQPIICAVSYCIASYLLLKFEYPPDCLVGDSPQQQLPIVMSQQWGQRQPVYETELIAR